MTNDMICPCGDQENGQRKLYRNCCEPFIKRQAKPVQCEQLMRSRYSAYAMGAVDYLLHTWHPSKQSELSREELLRSANETNWLRLDVLNHSDLAGEGGEGTVEFKAYYRNAGEEPAVLFCLHEVSRFQKLGDQWVYVDGELAPSVEVSAGRNDPCPCGSGKKFKKCCSA